MSTDPKRILVVEDDPALRRACQVALSKQGFSVQVAVDGQQALDILASDVPDVILLDLLMPRVSGLDVLRRVRSAPATKDVPVVVLSNSSRPDHKKETEELGISGYFVKANLSLAELVGMVSRLLTKQS